MLKRLLAALVVALVPAQSFAQPKPVTVIVESGALESAFKTALAKFSAARPDIVVNLQSIPYEQYLQVMTTRVAGGVAPDIAYMRGRFSAPLNAQELLADISGLVPENYLAGLNPIHRQENVAGATRYAVPYTVNIQSLMVNVDLMKKAGIPVPQTYGDAWTWPQLLAAMRNVKAQGLVDQPLLHWPVSTPSRFSQYLFGLGGSVLTADRTGPNLDNELTRAYLRDLRDTFTEGLAPQDNFSITSDVAVRRWLGGKAAVLVGGGNFMIPAINQAGAAAFEWAFSPMPVTLGQSAVLAVFRGGETRSEVVAVLDFLLKPETVTAISARTFTAPVSSSVSDEDLVSVYGQHAKSIRLLVSEQLRGLSEGLLGELNHPAWPEIDLALRVLLEQFALGQTDVDAFVREGEKQIRTILARY